MHDKVTILIYTFPEKGNEGAAFRKIAESIARTWKCVGELRTVVVASHSFGDLDAFAARHANVAVQIEPSLVHGDIRTMSLDCIKRLYRRFETPYVLVIQDDGYPLRPGLEEFVGKVDYYGAPIISDGWKRKFAYAIGMGAFNGGFSLRSRRLCAYAAKMWKSFFSKFVSEKTFRRGEDVYYTTWLKFLPMTWFKFRYPSERAAFRFAVDRLDGRVTPQEDVRPFGVHGKLAIEEFEKRSGSGFADR